MSKLEQEGLVRIISDFKFGNGCIEYQVEDLFTGQKFPHTEFPPHWDIEKIAQETKNLYDTAINTGVSSQESIKPFTMTTQDHFNLKFVTTDKPLTHDCTSIENTINKHIITAHPIREIKK